MKVIHYNFGKEGGAENFFVHLVNGLARAGVEQTCFIRPGRLWRKDIAGVAQIVENNFRYLSLGRLLLPFKAIRMARKEKPTAMFAWMTRASRLMPAYDDCIKISRLGNYPRHLGFFKNTDVLVCNTPGIAEHVRQLGWKKGIEVISNFTNTERVEPVSRASLETPDDATVVMSMGRFVRRKGFHNLIEAISKLPDTYLWLAGDGEERSNLEKMVSDFGMSHRVRFLGWKKDVRPFLAAADIFVMPSINEPLGNVILEAWAQGKPVVSSRSEGPQWFMRDGENGLMVDVNDVGGYVNAIASVANNKVLANKLAEGGRQTLMSQFSEEAVVAAYIELFKRQI